MIDAPRHAVERGMFVRDYPAGTSRPPLLFIHGLGESGLCFERIALHPKLSGYRRWVIDLPGYGRSAWRTPCGSLTELADLLASWLSERAGPRPVLVGHSMGGVLALIAAERHPDAFAGVVDVDGNKSLGDCGFSGRAASFSIDEFEANAFEGLMASIYEEGMGDPALRGYYASLRLCDPRCYHAHSVELVALSREEQLAKRLAELRLPKLYIAGQPRGACARSIELLEEAGIPWISVAPAGHWPFLDQPDAFATALETFCERR